jgi:S-adenosylmethionine synthetase
MTND